MVPTNNLSGEAGLRQAAQALIYEIRNLKRWPADAPATADSCWADVSERWLPRLNGVLDALESIPPAAPVERKPSTTASTHRLPLARGAPGALRLLGTRGGLGVAPLAGPASGRRRSAASCGAALPDVAREVAAARRTLAVHYWTGRGRRRLKRALSHSSASSPRRPSPQFHNASSQTPAAARLASQTGPL